MKKGLSRKVLGIPILWIIASALLVTTVVAAVIIISNILGPYRIHVGPQPSQLLVLSASTTPPSEVSLGATVNITIMATNPTSGSVKGYVVVNITASDFTPATSDISLSLRTANHFGGWSGEFGFPSPTPISGGFMYKTQHQFTWTAGCADTATIYITFNKANPTDAGYYEVTLAISSN